MLAKNIIRQFATQIIGLISGLLISIITSRVLGPAGRGDLSLLLNTSSFINLLFGFSFGSSIIHFISSKTMPQRSILNSFSILVLILILICGLFIYLFPFSKFPFLLPKDYVNNKTYYSSFLLLIFIISMLSTLYNSVLSANKVFWKLQKVFIISTGISIIAYVCLYNFYTNSTISFTFFLNFYLFLFTIPLIGSLVVYNLYSRPKFSFAFLNFQELKHTLSFSKLAYIGNIFQFLSYKMDFWFIGYFAGNANLGIYSLAVNLSQMLWLLPQAISTILISYTAGDSLKKSIQNTNTLSRIAMLFLLMSAIVLGLLAHLLIPNLYGIEFTGSISLLQILLIGVVPFSITTILASYFAGVGNIKVNLYCSFIGFLISLIFDLILIPIYGTFGAAIATVLAYSASTLYILFAYLRITKSKLVELIVFSKNDFYYIKSKLSNFLIKHKS